MPELRLNIRALQALGKLPKEPLTDWLPCPTCGEHITVGDLKALTIPGVSRVSRSSVQQGSSAQASSRAVAVGDMGSANDDSVAVGYAAHAEAGSIAIGSQRSAAEARVVLGTLDQIEACAFCGTLYNPTAKLRASFLADDILAQLSPLEQLAVQGVDDVGTEPSSAELRSEA